MSYKTVNQAFADLKLRDRVAAAVAQEAWAGAMPAGELRRRARADPSGISQPFVVAVAVDYRDAYAYAVETGNQNPGGDVAVITDSNIAAAVQSHWAAVSESFGV